MSYIGIDIGGTDIKYGVLNDELQFIELHKMPSDAILGGDKIFSKCISIIEEFTSKYTDILGIGISTTGVVDKDGNIFYANSNIPNYTGLQVK